MKIAGAPPESVFPYDGINKNPLSQYYYDKNPAWFIEQAAKANRITGDYVRLDTPIARKSESEELVRKMCRVLANGTGTPIMGGFYLADSGDDMGYFKAPKTFKDVVGGHAMLIVGYDTKARTFTVMNSWGMEWGVNGFGQVPFEFITRGFASDFWIVTDYSYVESSRFSSKLMV
jgi:C1A family cysteine protease